MQRNRKRVKYFSSKRYSYPVVELKEMKCQDGRWRDFWKFNKKPLTKYGAQKLKDYFKRRQEYIVKQRKRPDGFYDIWVRRLAEVM